VRAARDRQRMEATLEALRRDAGEGRNLVPAILECVRAEASLGEISNTLRRIYGEHRDHQAG
jgi:methylmalonyl-CoA mutase N-terminal domain/subunit